VAGRDTSTPPPCGDLVAAVGDSEGCGPSQGSAMFRHRRTVDDGITGPAMPTGVPAAVRIAFG